MFSKVWNKKNSYKYTIYKQYRNILNRLIKFAKQNYYETTIFNSINDPKRLWYNVKIIKNLKSKRKIVPQKI